MKIIHVFLLAFGLLVLSTGCMKDEPEIEVCSCTTTERDVDGILLSQVNSAVEAPISGNCLDLNFFTTGPETGNTTSRMCN